MPRIDYNTNNNKKMAIAVEKKSMILDLIVKRPGIRYQQLLKYTGLFTSYISRKLESSPPASTLIVLLLLLVCISWPCTRVGLLLLLLLIPAVSNIAAAVIASKPISVNLSEIFFIRNHFTFI